jgi:hypothetical protein
MAIEHGSHAKGSPFDVFETVELTGRADGELIAPQDANTAY